MPTGGDILAKALMPTAASSAEIRETVSAQIRERSLFSARNTSARALGKLQKLLGDIADGRINQAAARSELRAYYQVLGYDADTGFPGDSPVPPAERGGLTDLISPRRINLVLETNTRLARSAKQAADGSSDYALYSRPAWSLERVYARQVPRVTWGLRWMAAGNAVGWEGAARPNVSLTGTPRMVALKGSPIWDALGNGAGGYKDVLGSAVPPFAYGSGLGWVSVKRAQALALGLLDDAQPKPVDADISPTQNEWDRLFDAVGGGAVRDVLRDLGGAA